MSIGTKHCCICAGVCYHIDGHCWVMEEGGMWREIDPPGGVV